ncbi:MAG: YqjK family protein [Gammaproteobacteria bacterium]
MSDRSDGLRYRREALLRHGEDQRQDLRDYLNRFAATLDGVDRGLSLVRRLATPPVLLASGVLAILLVGRGGKRRVLAGGLATFGLLRRAGSAGRVLAQLARSQLVRRSR